MSSNAKYTNDKDTHLISVLMENEAGALARFVGLFSQRGYNIETLNVAPTHDPSVSRLTLTTKGDAKVIEQITKQLNKLVEVIRVVALDEHPVIARESMLIKVRAHGAMRDEVMRLASIFRGHILDVTPEVFTVLLTGTHEKLDGFLQNVGPERILEVARSGYIGVSRGEKSLSV